MQALLAAGQWVNVAALLLQLLNDATNTFPSLAGNHWVVMIQAILAAILPSVGGISHKIAGTQVVPKS